MEDRNIYETEEEQDRDDLHHDTDETPHDRPPHTQIDTSAIEPTGTGCRACIILILLVGAILGFIYLFLMGGPPTQSPTP